MTSSGTRKHINYEIMTSFVTLFSVLGKFGVSADVLSCRDSSVETIISKGTYISGLVRTEDDQSYDQDFFSGLIWSFSSRVTLILLVAIVSAATASDFYSDPNDKGMLRVTDN